MSGVTGPNRTQPPKKSKGFGQNSIATAVRTPSVGLVDSGTFRRVQLQEALHQLLRERRSRVARAKGATTPGLVMSCDDVRESLLLAHLPPPPPRASASACEKGHLSRLSPWAPDGLRLRGAFCQRGLVILGVDDLVLVLGRLGLWVQHGSTVSGSKWFSHSFRSLFSVFTCVYKVVCVLE